MRILGIESSCDETAAAVIEAGPDGGLHILSSVIASQVDQHRLYGGVVPEIASRAHIEVIDRITREALKRAGMQNTPADLVAVTACPGLIGCLLVGVNFAKSLAAAWGVPVVPVDHVKGHIAAVYLAEDELPPVPPYLALAVSGAHTAFYLVQDYTRFVRLGDTRDDAAGEAFDKVGRLIGIPYPAGAGFDQLAAEGFREATPEGTYEAYAASPEATDPVFHLPSPALAGDTPDFSFSGLKTAAVNLLNRYTQKKEAVPRARFAARYTYEVVEGIARQAGKVLNAHPAMPLVLAGGVAANSHLRHRLTALCQSSGRRLYILPLSLCGDNGAMIAAQGWYEYLAGVRGDAALNASACDSV